MSIEIIKKDLEWSQMTGLVKIVKDSGVFSVDDGGYVTPTGIPSNYPKNAMGPLAVGIIAGNKAQLLNVGKMFPMDYHAQLRTLYQSV